MISNSVRREGAISARFHWQGEYLAPAPEMAPCSGTHYPPRLDRVVGTELPALETADTDVGMDGIRLVTVHLKDSHGALVDARSAADAERRVHVDFNKKRDRCTLHGSIPSPLLVKGFVSHIKIF